MKLLASDYDGTLRSEALVSEKDKEAIKKFRQAGNMFAIVTGRSMESLRKEIEVNQFEYDFLITNNGGVIYDQNNELLQCSYMSYEHATSIIQYIKTLDCVSYVINDGYARFKFSVDPNQIDHKYANVDESKVSEAALLDKGKIAQIVISLNDSNLAKEIAQHINTQYNGYAHAYVNVNCVDIVPDGVSKGEALHIMEEHLNVNHDDVYAIGDSYNDLAMIEAFHGCCVSYAVEDVQKVCEHVFDGICECIEYLMEN